MKKVLLTILLLVILVIAGVAAYVKFALPNVGPASDLHITVTPTRIQNGEYLANHVSVCMDCHSTRDWGRFSGPLKPGTLGKGGEYFGEELGFPGKFYSKNLTPFNLKDWTDGELFRAITTGVDKSGNALFPLMPYLHFGKMDKEDIYDIIAYIRNLSPLENKTEDHSLNFPMNFIINTIPAKAEFIQKTQKWDMVKYGAYLVNAANCITCHAREKKGEIIPEFAFSGGREFKMPNGIARSANITPDNVTGIGGWSETAFLSRFKAYLKDENLPDLTPDKVILRCTGLCMVGWTLLILNLFNTYLRTLKPISNQVEHFTLGK